VTLRTAPAPSTRPDPSTLSTLSTLGQLLDHAVRTWPDRPALSFPGGGVRVSWAELDRLVAAAADRLAARGIGPGGRVGTMMANRLDYPVTWLACARLGAAMVPINVNYRSLDTGYVLQHSGVTVVVTDGPRMRPNRSTSSTSTGTRSLPARRGACWPRRSPQRPC